MSDLFTSPGFDLKPLDPSRLTDLDRAKALDFADVLPKVIEPAPGEELAIADLARAVNKTLGRKGRPGIPTSSIRRLAKATGFRLRSSRVDRESYVRDARLRPDSDDVRRDLNTRIRRALRGGQR